MLLRYFILTVMSSTALILVPMVSCGLSLLLVAPILFKLYRRCEIEEITPEWLESFCPSSYYPMQGLLAEEDFRFLAQQPGFDFSLYRKLRRERLHIFHQYLNRIIRDFNRLHATARALLAHGREDRSEMVGQLMLLKLKFSMAAIQAEFSYVLCCVGFRSLAARAMIMHLEQMSTQLTVITAASAA